AGAVGRQVVNLLEARRFPVGELRLLATKRSAGEVIPFRGEPHTVVETEPERFEGVDLVFLAAGTGASRELAPEAVRRGAVVIDKSNAFRMDPEVPLVVPEVNPDAAADHKGIVASPNCSTIQMVVAVKPLADRAGLRRLLVSTYQSVSGSGQEAILELQRESESVLNGEEGGAAVYPHPIAFNVLPHIDTFCENGYTQEEMKMTNETRKILGDPDLPVSATAVRVPVFVGHSEAVLVETEEPLSVEAAREALRGAPGVVLEDDPTENRYPLPIRAAGRDEVFVGRIRKDLTCENGLHLWVVADNLRKGAATNAIQIAELLIERGWLP
ncbi:MAG TPA: aspartate-semialdehyde dehydrogenase, partial [Planctomycetaceae bacterium]